jgi:ATP/maltotriose-dependent transcriptional regulator MalT
LAASLAEHAGNPLSAIRHYLEARSFDDARRLAEQVIPELEVRWEFGLIRQVLEGYPEGRLSDELKWVLVNAYIELGEPKQGEILAQKLGTAGVSHRGGTIR